MPRKKLKVEQSTECYLRIGHQGYNDGYYDTENPNYLWVSIDGRLEARQETEDCQGHHEVDEWLAPTRQFNGRYDGQKKLISCVPRNTSNFRELPQTLISQLQQKFPKAKKIVICN